MENFDEKICKQEIKAIDWTDLYNQTDVNLTYNIFSEKFCKILNNMAPMRKSQIRKKHTPWITEQTKAKMLERNIARDVAVTSSRQEDWKHYRLLRNRCTTEVKKDRTNYHKLRYEQFERNNEVKKNLYNQFKNQMGWKRSGPPNSFNVDNKIIRKPTDIANCQNNYYTEKTEKLNEKLPPNRNNPLTTLKAALERWGYRSTQIKTLTIQPVGIGHTLNLIKKLGYSTFHGYDGINASSLKIAAKDIATPINFIINLSISTSHVSQQMEDWKTNSNLQRKRKGHISLNPTDQCPFSL